MRNRLDPVYTAIAFGPAENPSLITRSRRILPDVPGRWDRWRTTRANVRRLPEQIAASEEIRAWLTGLLGERGSIVSFDLQSWEDEVRLRVAFEGRTGQLTFCFLQHWSEVEPRDQLAKSALEVLRGRDNFDHEFWLSGYAEESYITSDRYRSDRNH